MERALHKGREQSGHNGATIKAVKRIAPSSVLRQTLRDLSSAQGRMVW